MRKHNMDTIIYHSIVLRCSPLEAFEFFTGNKHLEKWLTKVADVEPKVSGKYELFWNPEDRENDSTIGCKILAVAEGRFLSFEWKGPRQFKHFMNDAKPLTNVVVMFIPTSEGTEVYLLHTGWRDTAEWEEARQWFDKAWTTSLSELQNYIKET
ncbi:SRPBCC domain-containing protein [Candidatus Bathyarchaeota archaeon]|nr:SRPBCC domain-containing protein [Candidatus Bathyarchaeota archaeon]